MCDFQKVEIEGMSPYMSARENPTPSPASTLANQSILAWCFPHVTLNY